MVFVWQLLQLYVTRNFLLPTARLQPSPKRLVVEARRSLSLVVVSQQAITSHYYYGTVLNFCVKLCASPTEYRSVKSRSVTAQINLFGAEIAASEMASSTF